MKLEGAVAFVLGGARGIGKAYCISLLERKAKVCCADRLEDVGQETESELRAIYGDANFVFRVCNGMVETQIRDTMAYAQTYYGRLDIVVNNVGYWNESDYQTVMNINLGTAIRVTNVTLSLLGKDKGGNGGVLVHTASNGGLVTSFVAPVYSATKAAIVHYTRCWANEINYQFHGVRMFTICPIVTTTDFVNESMDPKKCVHMEIFTAFIAASDTHLMLKASDVGEALIEGLLDDSANGVALQMITPQPKFLFRGENNHSTMRDCKMAASTANE